MFTVIEDFLRFKQYSEARAEATVVKYRGYLERLQAFLEERDLKLLEATGPDLEEFAGLFMHREGLSPRSRRALVAAIRGFYGWAQRFSHIPRDPSELLPYPSAGRPLPVAMQLGQAERLLMQPDISTFAGIRDAAIIATIMGGGFRISGVVALNESQLQFVDIGGTEWLLIKVTEKGKKERQVPMPHEARLLIRAYLGHEELQDIDRTLPSGDRVLFVSVRNRKVPEHEYHGEARRLAVRSVRDMIVQRGEAAGIPRDVLHPHALRHLYGTELAEDDVDLVMRGALLGHADPKTTEIYTHLAMRKLTQVVGKANPLGKVRTPVTDLLRKLERG